MNVLSLFDGMSCGQLALSKLGIEVENYYASEIDKYAISICKKNFPDTHHIGDVLDIKGKDLPQIDLLIGGSPCQGFSFAGKMLNFEDPRSKLFFEYVRLLKETKPKFFLLENVKMKQEHQDIISDQLGVKPIEINSALVAPHRRKRLYWTNIPGVGQPEEKETVLSDVIENGWVDREKSYCLDASYYKGGSLKLYFEKSRRQLVFTSEKGVEPKAFRKLLPIECERLQTVPDNYTEGVSNSQRYKMLGNGWTIDVIAHIFKGMK